MGNEATCAPTSFYFAASTLDIQRQACDLLNKYGINAFEAGRCLIYLNDLNRRGVLGPGKEIDFPYWGFPNHFDPRTELEWGYGSILGDRDINEHGINTIFMDVWVSRFMGKQPRATAEETVKIYTEPKFLNAVTGKNFTFLDGIEPGKKIWNLDHAIWTLQGRHRDMVHFADYIYRVPYAGFSFMPSSMTSRRNGKWEYTDIYGRCMDREKFEEFKTRFYRLEGWDPDTGYPSRSTLTGLPLEYVADELEKNGKLGKG